MAQRPYALPTTLTIDEAAGDPNTMRWLVVVTIVAVLLIGPALALLYRLDLTDRLAADHDEDLDRGAAGGGPGGGPPDWGLAFAPICAGLRSCARVDRCVTGDIGRLSGMIVASARPGRDRRSDRVDEPTRSGPDDHHRLDGLRQRAGLRLAVPRRHRHGVGRPHAPARLDLGVPLQGALPEALKDGLLGDKLHTYAWVWLIVAILLIVSSWLLLYRSQLARWVGFVAATIGALSAMVWMPYFPIWSLTYVGLFTLTFYALAVHGGRTPSL